MVEIFLTPILEKQVGFCYNLRLLRPQPKMQKGENVIRTCLINNFGSENSKFEPGQKRRANTYSPTGSMSSESAMADAGPRRTSRQPKRIYEIDSIRLSAPYLSQPEKKSLQETLQTGYIASGPKTKEFEEKFSQFTGAKFAVATANGTAALHTALKCLGIKEKDSVLTTPFSFIATSNSILYCGATPVFCDICIETFNISPEEIKKALKKNSSAKAVLCVHLFGLPCDIGEIRAICKQKGLLLIEDCAQAHGAEYKNKKVGSFGDCAIFSFYATKNMTTAEGGMITTNIKSLDEKCRQFINHGRDSKNKFSMLGYNYRLTDIASSLGLAQLEKLDFMNSKRIENARYLSENLASCKNIILPTVPLGYKHVFHQYVIRVKNKREKLRQYLKGEGIESAIFYPVPIYRQQVYKTAGYGNYRLKNTELACKQVLSLPVHPSLTKTDLEKIVQVLKQWEK